MRIMIPACENQMELKKMKRCFAKNLAYSKSPNAILGFLLKYLYFPALVRKKLGKNVIFNF